MAYNLTILIMPWSDHHSLNFVSGLLLMTKISQFKIIQFIIVYRRLSYQGIFHRACFLNRAHVIYADCISFVRFFGDSVGFFPDNCVL